MLILGLLLIAAALVVFGYLFFGTKDLDPLQIDLGVFTVELTPLHLFLLGAATLVVLVLGLAALAAGMRASRRRRQEVKDLRRAVRDGGSGYGASDSGGSGYGGSDSGRREPVPAPVEDVDRREAPSYEPEPVRGESAPYEREVPSSYPSQQPAQGADDRDIALPSDYAEGTVPGEATPGDTTPEGDGRRA